jgi:hypothetical protein
VRVEPALVAVAMVVGVVAAAAAVDNGPKKARTERIERQRQQPP